MAVRSARAAAPWPERLKGETARHGVEASLPGRGVRAHGAALAGAVVALAEAVVGLAGAVVVLAGAGLPCPASAAERPLTPGGTDTPLWRATHGLLLGIARAGTRVVAVGTAGTVLLSDDEGAHWTIAHAPTDAVLAAAVFPTAREGWVVGQDQTILHSTDGGETWTVQHTKAEADQTLFTAVAFTPSHLFTSGAYNLILETENGADWKESKIDNLDDDYHLNCAVARGNDVLVTGESGHAFIRYAGAWTPMKLPYDGSQFACAVGPDGSFYSFGLRGSAFKALPGAAQWQRIDTGTQASFFGAANLADGRIALVGANGSIRLLDPDSGKVATLPAVGEATLSAVIEVRPGKLIAVGEDGVHLIDIAGGLNQGGLTPGGFNQ